MKTENLQTLKIHKLTQEQYERELNAGRIDENALYLTPDEYTNDIEDLKKALNNKADKEHYHNETYYTKLEIDNFEFINDLNLEEYAFISVNEVDEICIANATLVNITYNLSNVTSVNTGQKAVLQSSYETTLTPNTGYTIKSVTVTMGGSNITSTAYNSSTNKIKIDRVTGDIVITATTTARVYTVTYNLSKVNSSATQSTATHNTSFSSSLSLGISELFCSSGSNQINVTVTMGGTDVTSSVWNSSTKKISTKVTGNIVITAVANTLTNFINKGKTTLVTSGGTTYTYGPITYNGEALMATGYIYDKPGTTYIFGGMDFSSNGYIELFKTVSNNINSPNLVIDINDQDTWPSSDGVYFEEVMDEAGDYYYQLTLGSSQSNYVPPLGFMRVICDNIDEDSIIVDVS